MQLSDIGEVDLDKLEEETKKQEEIERLRKLAEEPVYCSAFIGKEKEKKLKKKCICALCSAAVSFLVLCGSLIGMTVCAGKAEDIVEKSGYDEANTLYKAEMAIDIHESFVNGELSQGEYEKKLDGLKDLDKYEHVKATLGEADAENFKSLRRGETAGVIATLPTTVLTGITGGLAIVYATQEGREKRRQDARDARYARMLGGK